MKILVIDDDITCSEFLSLLLKESGNEVATAPNGLEGCRRQEEFQADIIITDLNMPKGNGFLVLSETRARQPDLPVILISGSWTEEEKRKALNSGASAVLEKPIDSQLLLRKIDSSFIKHRGVPPPPSLTYWESRSSVPFLNCRFSLLLKE